MWRVIEIAMGKTLEQMIDFSTMKWVCKPCKDKMKFFSEESIMNAAKEKKYEEK